MKFALADVAVGQLAKEKTEKGEKSKYKSNTCNISTIRVYENPFYKNLANYFELCLWTFKNLVCLLA